MLVDAAPRDAMIANHSGKSSIIVALLLMTQICQIADATQTIDGRRPLNAQKAFACPALVRANNWEIEKFFGTWNGIEMFVHNGNGNSSSSSSETFEDSCMHIRVVEVNELNEEMTYGKSIDPFNFRLALRHLKVRVVKNRNIVTELFMTFNNTNQMLWHGGDVVMQIIKYDGIQMMMTICARERGELYTISAHRTDESGARKEVDITKKYRLILQGRNLRVHSQFNLQSSCDGESDSAYSSGQFNFRVMFPSLTMLFAANAVLHSLYQLC